MPTNWVAEKVAGSPRWLTYTFQSESKLLGEKFSGDTHLDSYRSIYIDQVYMGEPLLDLLNLEILHRPAKETLQRADCVAKI
jgi:hypothetical protein